MKGLSNDGNHLLKNYGILSINYRILSIIFSLKSIEKIKLVYSNNIEYITFNF